MNKNALYKFITLIYSEFGEEFDFDKDDMRENVDPYDTISMFLMESLGLSYDEADFVYASYVETIEKYDINSLTVDDVIIPKLANYDGVKTYVAEVVVKESYTYETYLPAIMRSAIQEYVIDSDSTDITEYLDTWGHEIEITKSKGKR